LCGRKGFAAERTVCGKRFRLIDLEIGHALKNDGSFWPNSFSLKEAVVRLRSLERDPAI
jgi:hypothetical protein